MRADRFLFMPIVLILAVAAPAPLRSQSATNTQGSVSIDQVSPDTRVVPLHVYDARRNTTGFNVPAGYKRVWTDGRLNPRRAEQTLRPSRIIYGAGPPRGYRSAWADDRLNLQRRARTERGNTQMSRVWNGANPGKLVEVPTGVRILTIPRERKNVNFPYFGTQLPDLPPEAARDPQLGRASGGSR